ncbi:unnamed protein product [Acanthosepion pharaonis]|uniref:Uncharacterized protein n=1 Tax=Acanthosepion pharaonis TaxID=158019 RepID=A0A812EST3_ACAPH|nr:unnamed protein product [Sepia pharaonis]
MHFYSCLLSMIYYFLCFFSVISKCLSLLISFRSVNTSPTTFSLSFLSTLSISLTFRFLSSLPPSRDNSSTFLIFFPFLCLSLSALFHTGSSIFLSFFSLFCPSHSLPYVMFHISLFPSPFFHLLPLTHCLIRPFTSLSFLSSLSLVPLTQCHTQSSVSLSFLKQSLSCPPHSMSYTIFPVSLFPPSFDVIHNLPYLSAFLSSLSLSFLSHSMSYTIFRISLLSKAVSLLSPSLNVIHNLPHTRSSISLSFPKQSFSSPSLNVIDDLPYLSLLIFFALFTRIFLHRHRPLPLQITLPPLSLSTLFFLLSIFLS